MNEFMWVVHGVYDVKTEDFVPGGASLHNCMSAHDPTAPSVAELAPQKIEEILAFMFEAGAVDPPDPLLRSKPPALRRDYDACWAGFENFFEG